MATKLSENSNYVMHFVEGRDASFDFLIPGALKTLFLHEGYLKVDIFDGKQMDIINVAADEGLTIMPNVKLKVLGFQGSLVSVQSDPNKKPILEIVDEGNVRSEETIEFYKKISNPKKVIKPWGYEVWISWFKNHHVLKKIYMRAGNKCSLQYHEKKSETNVIISGKANVMKGIFLADGVKESDALVEFEKIKDIKKYITTMGENDYWDNKPFEIHRVFSIDSYTAYEASTAELDDVIRLQDDNNRSSGLIKSEHEL